MSWKEHSDADGQTSLLRDLLASGFMLPEDVGYTEAVVVRDRGISALSEAQRITFIEEVAPVLEAYDQVQTDQLGRDAGQAEES